MDLEFLYIILKIAVAALGIIAAILLIIFRFRSIIAVKNSEKIERDLNLEKFSPQYTGPEIAHSLTGYIEPDCSVTDPANEMDIVSYADVRQNIFTVMDKVILYSSQRRHQLILADSGMGKTSFCINYFKHYRKKNKGDGIALISLAQRDAQKRIETIERKSSTVLLLDALDEDAEAIKNGPERLYDLLQIASDFRCVIVTCRSQFFPNDAAIPTETGVSIVTPRRAGQNISYKLYRTYLAPFDERQIRSFIRKHFPIWSLFAYQRRKKAHALVANVKELAARPMLLELLPELVKDKRDSQEIFDLYKFMIDKWLERESSWIAPDNLLEISKRLAVMVHRQQSTGGGDRITLQQLNSEAESVHANLEGWKYLTTRSLLNRDSDGRYKFAHRSIMEYLFVVRALEGVDNCFDVRWTDLMRDFFVSWGYTDTGIRDLDLARAILRRDLAATGLWPLSEPPAQPSFVGLPDFERAATRRDSGPSGRRSANALWRKDSVRLDIRDGLVGITDLEYNLYWQIMDRSIFGVEGGKLPLKQTVGRMQRLAADRHERLPSYAEFVTLLECLEAVGRPDLVPDRKSYLLGDSLGERRHLIAIVGLDKEKSKYTVIVDKDRRASFTNRKVTALETGIYVDPASLNSVTVVPLLVTSALQ